ncbi:DUF6894 family protein [Rhizobium halophytocola]|uniref:DUF6894 domain-containing protein n=1 Tax=Rhizobium halophytocola TaxID=735519 RepID=A0ABS4DSZ9_9HYPH|nr:hypothetical protein [Rhizobium halophytocola]MBP1848819.1 hypothetical protein [Rhizobium halophytocola]
MTRYYFDLATDHWEWGDDEGVDLPDRARVDEELVKLMRDLFREAVMQHQSLNLQISVRDPGGSRVAQACVCWRVSSDC